MNPDKYKMLGFTLFTPTYGLRNYRGDLNVNSSGERTMKEIIIDVGKQLDGFTFRLNPVSRIKLQERFPGINPVSSVFVSYDTYEEKDFGMLPESVWKYVAIMLTGFSENQFEKSGGFIFINPLTGKEIFKSGKKNV